MRINFHLQYFVFYHYYVHLSVAVLFTYSMFVCTECRSYIRGKDILGISYILPVSFDALDLSFFLYPRVVAI